MARSRTGQILPEGSRVYVEEQLFRADVEERLFRAASACAFDWGLQPRPALKGIHPPAVAAMNGRSSTLTQALVLRARRSIQTEGNPGTPAMILLCEHPVATGCESAQSIPSV